MNRIHISYTAVAVFLSSCAGVPGGENGTIGGSSRINVHPGNTSVVSSPAMMDGREFDAEMISKPRKLPILNFIMPASTKIRRPGKAELCASRRSFPVPVHGHDNTSKAIASFISQGNTTAIRSLSLSNLIMCCQRTVLMISLSGPSPRSRIFMFLESFLVSKAR